MRQVLPSKLIHGGDIYSEPGMLDFSANINPLGTPDSVYQAVRNSMENGEWAHYPDPLCRELSAAIADREKVCADEILCGCGAADLLYRLVLAVKLRRALIPIPTFAEYQLALNMVGCQVEHYILSETDGFRLQQDFLERLTSKIDAVFLCHPNNPTGWTVEQSLLEEIFFRCQREQILLVVDECFLEFVQNGVSLVGLRQNAPNLLILRAFTKTYALAGLRIGYAICSNRLLLQGMQQAGQPWSVSVPAQIAGIAACNESLFLEQSRVYIAEQKQLLKAALIQMGFTVIGSEANYLFFYSPQPNLSQRLQKSRILIRDCSNYIGLNKGYYRIAVRTDEENRRFLNALKQIMEG